MTHPERRFDTGNYVPLWESEPQTQQSEAARIFTDALTKATALLVDFGAASRGSHLDVRLLGAGAVAAPRQMLLEQKRIVPREHTDVVLPDPLPHSGIPDFKLPERTNLAAFAASLRQSVGADNQGLLYKELVKPPTHLFHSNPDFEAAWEENQPHRRVRVIVYRSEPPGIQLVTLADEQEGVGHQNYHFSMRGLTLDQAKQRWEEAARFKKIPYFLRAIHISPWTTSDLRRPDHASNIDGISGHLVRDGNAVLIKKPRIPQTLTFSPASIAFLQSLNNSENVLQVVWRAVRKGATYGGLPIDRRIIKPIRSIVLKAQSRFDPDAIAPDIKAKLNWEAFAALEMNPNYTKSAYETFGLAMPNFR